MRTIPLITADVRRVSLRYDSLFTRPSLQEHAREYPDLCWTSEQREYIVGGRWKSRDDVGEILELSGPARGLRGLLSGRGSDGEWLPRRAALVESLVDAYQRRGAQLVVLSEREAERNAHAYRSLGFAAIEDVVYLRKPDAEAPAPRQRLVLRACTFADLDDLLALERRVFPWLWWYGVDEWFMISMLTDVETILAFWEGNLIGYETHTVRGWNGHLDRIGIDPAVQGQRFGEELLLHSIRRIGELGGRNVGLSTQRANAKAQRLYRKYGFRPTGQSLNFFGRVVDPAILPLLPAAGR